MVQEMISCLLHLPPKINVVQYGLDVGNDTTFAEAENFKFL